MTPPNSSVASSAAHKCSLITLATNMTGDTNLHNNNFRNIQNNSMIFKPDVNNITHSSNITLNNTILLESEGVVKEVPQLGFLSCKPLNPK